MRRTFIPTVFSESVVNCLKPAWIALLLISAVFFVSGCSGSSKTGASSATTTSLAVSASSIIQGTSLTLTATVSPSAATGSVTFYDGSATLTGSPSSGTASFSTSSLSTGTHTLKATYGGSSSYASSTSNSVTVTVTASSTASTTTTLTTSSSSVTQGSNVTLTATVSPSAATGTVTFYDGSSSLGSGTLSSGTATLSTSSLSVGTHSITASYGGSVEYASSTSSAVAVTVTSSGSDISTTTTLIASSSSVVSGSSVRLLALLSPMAATGAVTFYDGSTQLGTESLSAGTASFTTASLNARSHSLNASYGGDGSFLSSTSTSVALTVLSSSTGSWSSGTCGYGTAAYKLSSGTLDQFGSTYTTSVNDQSAVCVLGTSTNLLLTNPTITTSGATSSTDNSSFYGLDAAALDYNGGNLSIIGGTITTSGQGGNGVFAYGTGNVSIFDTTIKATGANGHGLYAAGGGTMVVNNVTASSTGASGSIVATDRGGGTITIIGGNYSAAGQRSAGIYSTGTVIGYGGTFSATNAEAVVIEGSNTVTLNNSTLNAVSSTGEHRGIFLYQSMSGDADNSTCGTGACFSMTGGTINYTDTYSSSSDATANCAAFVVANQVAHFALTDVTVNKSCPTLLLSALNTNWNYKGGTTTFKAFGDSLTGDVIVDSVSTADIYLYSSSTGASGLTGKINTANTGKTVSLTLDASSTWVVTGTSHLTSLIDADSSYGNITCQTSGCKVYVGSTAINID
jgi:hypothetical protein